MLDIPVQVSFVHSRQWRASAGYSLNHVTFNVTKLYHGWFEAAVDVQHDRLIIHELAHLIETNHTLKFWNIIKSQITQVDKAKQWLKQHGQLLEQKL